MERASSATKVIKPDYVSLITPKAFFLHYVITSSEKHPLNLSLPDVVTPQFLVDYQSSSKKLPNWIFQKSVSSRYRTDIKQSSS